MSSTENLTVITPHGADEFTDASVTVQENGILQVAFTAALGVRARRFYSPSGWLSFDREQSAPAVHML